MAVFEEGAHTGAWLMKEAAGTRSRDYITIAASQTIADGQLLGKVLTGALSAVAAAVAGNTGNGAMGAVTVDAGADEGVYKLLFIEPGSNAGDFAVERPDGVIDGHGKVAVAYNGRVNFTLADGATDFVAGDGFDITVTAADATAQDQFKAWDPAATDGTQIVAAIAYGAVETGVGATQRAVGITRDAEANGKLLVYPDAEDDEEVAAGIAGLTDLGIIVR